MTEKSLKTFQKYVKWCKKQGLSYAKCGSFEFSTAQVLEKPRKSVTSKSIGKSDSIEGLTTDESAKMPSDGDMLFYSTESFDHLTNSRKDPTPRN